MPATITNYYLFVQATKARAAQVNNNFANHRGTLVPINENTATASNLTHTMGTPEHRWSAGYMSTVWLGQTTTSWQIKDATQAVGDLIFEVGGVEKMRVKSGSQYTITAQFTSEVTVSPLSSANVPGSTLTILGHGAPIEYGLESRNSFSYILWRGYASGDTPRDSFMININKNGVPVGGGRLGNDNTNVGFTTGSWYPPSIARYIDFNVTAGVSNVYHLSVTNVSGAVTDTASADFFQVFAYARHLK